MDFTVYINQVSNQINIMDFAYFPSMVIVQKRLMEFQISINGVIRLIDINGILIMGIIIIITFLIFFIKINCYLGRIHGRSCSKHR